jgi:beta-galactosidase
VESCLEEELGLGEVATIAGESYLRAFERALTARGVPFAYAGGDSFEVSTRGARWIVCATAGGVKEDLFTLLRAARESGVLVTIGPRVPGRDGAMRPLKKAHDVRGLELEPLDDVSRADALVARRIEELGLPVYPVDPADAFVCVHEDDAGAPRVAFVLNPTAAKVVAKVGLARATALDDALRPDLHVTRASGAFHVELAPRTARMFVITQ